MSSGESSDEPRPAILVVDDRADKRLAIETILSSLDVEIVTARSGTEALRCLLRRDFAVILLDVNMPGMDGFETAALIRGRKSCEHTPIIFITVQSSETHVSHGYSLGAIDYVPSSIEPEILRTKVSFFVDLFRMTDQVKRQAAALANRAAQLQALAAASLAIHSAASTEDLLRGVVRDAARIVGSHQAFLEVTLPDDARQHEEHLWVSEKHESALASRERPPALGRWVAESTRVVRKSEKALHALERRSGGEEGLPLRGLLVAPLVGGDGQRIGAIGLSDRVADDFTADDEAILVQLAQMTSIAIENKVAVRAREANRMKDEFLALISHELRTPLSAIVGWTYLLRTGKLDAGTAHRALDVIEHHVEAQARLIDDLLDVSRIVTGKLVIHPRRTSLRAAVEAAADAALPAAHEKRIALSIGVAPPDDPAEVVADAGRLQQVLRNLLANAIQFTPERGRIDVHVERDGASWRVDVADTGEGIDADFLPHVFERFRQADSSTARAYGGLGLGLALVHHLVELHGGTVVAISEGRGKGATFRFTLPVAPVEAAAGEGAKTASDDARGRVSLTGVHVLVVDDEPDVRESIAVALEQCGARVSAAESAGEALAAIERERPDVVVSDIAMPERDGYELVRAIRGREADRTPPIPVVALTAYAGSTNRDRALDAGFDLHLTKPLDLGRLLDVVAQLAQPKPRIESANEESPLDGKPKRVLIVDDDADGAESLVMLLRMNGHDVRVARDGPSAVEAATLDPPDVVLLDIALPGMDGYAVAERLRQHPALHGTRLIALTGYGGDDGRSLAAGFHHHLVKPIDPAHLTSVLAGVGPKPG